MGNIIFFYFLDKYNSLNPKQFWSGLWVWHFWAVGDAAIPIKKRKIATHQINWRDSCTTNAYRAQSVHTLAVSEYEAGMLCTMQFSDTIT